MRNNSSITKVIIAIIVGTIWLSPNRATPSSTEDVNEYDCDPANQEESRLYKEYFLALTKAQEDCDLSKIQELGRSDDAALYPCLKGAAYKAEYSYFEKCLQPILEKEAVGCKLDKILEAEELLETSLKNWPNYRIMKEIVTKHKCIDFGSGCIKGFIEHALENCDFKQIDELEETILLYPLRSCPNYKRLKLSTLEAKSAYFYNCLQPKIEKAQGACDIRRVHQFEKFVADNMQDCFDYRRIIRDVSEIKCRGIRECLSTKLEKIGLDCDLTGLLQLRDIAPAYSRCSDISHWDISELLKGAEGKYLADCAPGVLDEVTQTCRLNDLVSWEKAVEKFSGIDGFMEHTQEKKCLLTANCLKQDMQVAVYNCDLVKISELEFQIEVKLKNNCPFMKAELKEFINIQKEAYLAKCITKELDIANSVCNIARIMEIEALIGSAKFKNCNNINKMRELAARSRDLYVEDCLKRDFPQAIEGCQLEDLDALINQLEPLVRQWAKKYKQLNQQIQDWSCQYMAGCLSEEIGGTITQADRDRLNFIKEFLEQRLSHCEQYPIYKEHIQQAEDRLPPDLPPE